LAEAEAMVAELNEKNSLNHHIQRTYSQTQRKNIMTPAHRLSAALVILGRSAASLAHPLGCTPRTCQSWLVDDPPPEVLTWVEAMAAAVAAIPMPALTFQRGRPVSKPAKRSPTIRPARPVAPPAQAAVPATPTVPEPEPPEIWHTVNAYRPPGA
jgi:hypothetical protein